MTSDFPCPASLLQLVVGSNCRVSSEAMHSVASLSHLQHLDITVKSIVEADMRVLAGLIQLQHCAIRGIGAQYFNPVTYEALMRACSMSFRFFPSPGSPPFACLAWGTAHSLPTLKRSKRLWRMRRPPWLGFAA